MKQLLIAFFFLFSIISLAQQTIEPDNRPHAVPHLTETTANKFDNSMSFYYVDLKGYWHNSNRFSDSLQLPLFERPKNKKMANRFEKKFEFLTYILNKKSGVYLHLEQLQPSFKIYLNDVLLNNSSEFYHFNFDITEIIKAENTIVIEIADQNATNLQALQDLYVFGSPTFYFYKQNIYLSSFGGYFLSSNGINRNFRKNDLTVENTQKIYLNEFIKPTKLKKSYAVKEYSYDTLQESYYKFTQHTRSTFDKPSKQDWGMGLAAPDIPFTWNSEQPKLYKGIFKTKVHPIQDSMFTFQHIGVRTNPTQQKNQVFLNGKTISFKPVMIHNISETREQLRQKVLTMKRSNINTVLLSGYAPNDFFHWCDTLGIYVVYTLNFTNFARLKHLSQHRVQNTSSFGYCFLPTTNQVEVDSIRKTCQRERGTVLVIAVPEIPFSNIVNNRTEIPAWEAIENNVVLQNKLKEEYAPVDFSNLEMLKKNVTITNKFDFLSLDEHFVIFWELLVDGKKEQGGESKITDILPHQSQTVPLQIQDFTISSSKKYQIKLGIKTGIPLAWAEANHVLAESVFDLILTSKK